MILERSCPHLIRRSTPGSPAWLLGLVFVLGIAVGTLIPAREHLSGPSPSVQDAPSANSSLESPSAGWNHDGNLTAHYAIEVLRVIDGDTFEARVHLWPGLEMLTRVRLRGIDAPEIKGACLEEQRMAEAAREALRAQLADGDVAIFNIGPDKYNGRVVADAGTRRTPSVSTALLLSGQVRAYRGGRRGGWCETALRAG